MSHYSHHYGHHYSHHYGHHRVRSSDADRPWLVIIVIIMVIIIVIIMVIIVFGLAMPIVLGERQGPNLRGRSLAGCAAADAWV